MLCATMKFKFLGAILLISGMFFFQTGIAQEKNKDTLVFGFFPYMNGSRIVKLYQPLASYLGQILNKKVIIVSAPSLENFIEYSDKGQYDLLFTAPHFALRAAKQKGYERLFRFDNELRATVFVTEDSEIQSLSELRVKKIAFPDKLMVVTALAQVYFQNQEVEVVNAYLPSHNNVIMSVENNQVDAGVIAEPIFSEYVKNNPGKLRKIVDTESIPGAMFMQKSDFTVEEKARIQQAFLNFETSNEGKSFFLNSPFKGFKTITEQELGSMQRYMEIIEERL